MNWKPLIRYSFFACSIRPKLTKASCISNGSDARNEKGTIMKGINVIWASFKHFGSVFLSSRL